MLVDFGHFQYNSIMLGTFPLDLVRIDHVIDLHSTYTGFTILAINFFATGQDLIGAFFFVLSLGFKQMALYYAPAIGSYLIAKCIYLGPVNGYVFC